MSDSHSSSESSISSSAKKEKEEERSASASPSDNSADEYEIESKWSTGAADETMRILGTLAYDIVEMHEKELGKVLSRKPFRPAERHHSARHHHEVPDDDESGKGSAKKKKEKREKQAQDPNKPKQPRGEWILWFSEQNARKSDPEFSELSYHEFQSTMGKRFKELSDAEKQPYKERVEKERKKYKEDMELYWKGQLPGQNGIAPDPPQQKPKRKRSDMETSTSAPASSTPTSSNPKKKAKKEKKKPRSKEEARKQLEEEFTPLKMYMDSKKDKAMAKNPEASEADVLRSLREKFDGLHRKKLKKYEQQANDEIEKKLLAEFS